MTSAFSCQFIKYQPPFLKKKTKEILAFDFDGVFHNKMLDGQTIETQHRSPDQDFLYFTFIDNPNALKKYLINDTIQKVRKAIQNGDEVYIVSANGARLQKPIHTLLHNIGIDMPLENIIMKCRNKPKTLHKLKATEFTDDSMVNIISVFDQSKKKNLPHLKSLIWAWPEKGNFYDIDLNQDKLTIFVSDDWATRIRTGSSIKGVGKIN